MRSTSTACSGARSRTRTSATGSTRSWPATATSPRRLVAVLRFAFEELALHRLQVAIIPRNQRQPAGRREARPAGGGHRRALPRDQRGVGGPRPLRHHQRGVGRAPDDRSATGRSRSARARATGSFAYSGAQRRLDASGLFWLVSAVVDHAGRDPEPSSSHTDRVRSRSRSRPSGPRPNGRGAPAASCDHAGSGTRPCRGRARRRRALDAEPTASRRASEAGVVVQVDLRPCEAQAHRSRAGRFSRSARVALSADRPWRSRVPSQVGAG